ncbi:heterokaryon incompatibility protein [Fusarium tjaetaba]|uniref:Heterokaryon incompatibility protein n=1 Tax=Fusarium tjaetaba TaxID=1567544 RepID=A0A8H5QX62_9HYPO|nr:heterokaryon incompatibility protein [Fusarium tjaetaba]KAF5623936.1 heterokaryon incompatibility protein [Fusarium tjaetaba]
MNLNYSEFPIDAGDLRLVSLDNWASDITEAKWKLRVVSMDQSPRYLALSYRWGAPIDEGPFKSYTDKPVAPIRIGNGELKVARNLLDFLIQVKEDENLRHEEFWIDAICINQGDLSERSYQVSNMMAKIYEKAHSVVAWLGDSDAHTAQAFDHMAKVADRSILPSLGIPTGRTGFEDFDADAARWLAVGKIFDRTYWNRSWIIQELVLPKQVTLRCGVYSTDWDVFAKASHNISTSPLKQFYDSRPAEGTLSSTSSSKMSRNYGVPAILDATKSTRAKRHWADVLLYTLIRSRHCEATDLADKVYALLGLIQGLDGDKKLPALLCPPTERSNCSPGKTYLDVATQLLEDCGDLLVLSCAEGFRNVKLNGADLPSWVPDWSVRYPLGLRVTGYKRYQADAFFFSPDTNLSRDEKLALWPATFDKSELTMTIRGMQVDKISFIAESKREILNSKPFPLLLRMLLMLPEKYQVTGEGRMEAFWRTITKNTYGEARHPAPKKSSMGPSFTKWLRETVQSASASPEDEDNWTNFKEAFNKFWPRDAEWLATSEESESVSSTEFSSQFLYGEYLRPFVTETGYIGLGSENLQEGDRVWVVPRSRVPLIFRHKEEFDPHADHHCQLIGGAYLHGFMDGSWRGKQATKEDTQAIIIH